MVSNDLENSTTTLWHRYSRAWRTGVVFLHDIVVSILALIGAYLLRFNLTIPAEFITPLWHSLYWVVPLQAIIFVKFGLYRGVWRFASVADLKRIFKAIAVATLTITVALVLFRPYLMMPRSVLVLDPILLF